MDQKIANEIDRRLKHEFENKQWIDDKIIMFKDETV